MTGPWSTACRRSGTTTTGWPGNSGTIVDRGTLVGYQVDRSMAALKRDGTL
ncbi:MAG: hypothetical protein WKF83_05290 [Nocardioidaceae bacterium]